MGDFVSKLQLKGMAEEDVYFAKRDRELLEALHKKKLAKQVKCGEEDEKKNARSYEKKFEKLSDKHAKRPGKLVSGYRKLLDDIRQACRRRKKSGG